MQSDVRASAPTPNLFGCVISRTNQHQYTITDLPISVPFEGEGEIYQSVVTVYDPASPPPQNTPKLTSIPITSVHSWEKLSDAAALSVWDSFEGAAAPLSPSIVLQCLWCVQFHLGGEKLQFKPRGSGLITSRDPCPGNSC